MYIDEVNMNYKINLREDKGIETVLFFEEDMTVVALLNHLKEEEKVGK